MNRWKMVDLKSQHFACVYKLVFPNGKIYIGKSKDIGKRIGLYEMKVVGKWEDEQDGRLYDDLKVFGLDSIGVEVLFKVIACNGVDSDRDLDYALGIVEMRWIKELDSSNPDKGYNATDGGEMFGIRRMEKIKEVEKVVYKDVIVERARERQTNGIPVVGYDINGDYIGEWPSRIAFTREVLGLKSYRAMDFNVWRKGFIMYEKSEPVADKVESYAEFLLRTKQARVDSEKIYRDKVGSRGVIRDARLYRNIVFVDCNLQEVGRYNGIKDAERQTGIAYCNIYACLKNGYGSTHGSYVFWADDWDEDKERCITTMRERKVGARQIKTQSRKDVRRKRAKHGMVYQYDVRFNEVGVYNTVREAAEKTGYDTCVIYGALKRGLNAFGGVYHWCYEADRIAPKETPAEPEQPAQPKHGATNTVVLFSDDDF